MKTKIKKMTAIWIATVLAAGCSACANNDHSASGTPAASSQKTADTIDALFPEEMDPDAYSQGIVNLSSQWKAVKDIPVYAQDEDRQPQDQIGTIPAGENFRVCTLATSPIGDPETPVIYGSLADGSGWALLYNHDLNSPVCAILESGYAWEQKIPLKVRHSRYIYGEVDGEESKEIAEQYKEAILLNLEKGSDGTPWGKSAEGYFPLYTREGPSVYSPIFGYTKGPATPDDSVYSAYNWILLGSDIDNFKGGSNWGAALADLNHDGRTEMMIASGALNKNQLISIYGATDKVLNGESNGTFPNACSILYQEEDGRVLRFQNISGDKTITRLEIENGELTKKMLTKDEQAAINPETLTRIEFTSIYNRDVFKKLETIALKEWYPDYSYESQGQGAPVNAENWILNYDMVLRSAPDRKSEQIGSRAQGEVVQIINSQSYDQETWGQTSDGGWICLQDSEYQYATMQ